MPDAVAPSWLRPDAEVERVPLGADSWVDVVRGLVPDADALHDELARTVAWEQGKVFRYERWVPEPRLSSWQTGPARHPALATVQMWVSSRYRVQFDGLALARYRDGDDSVAWHRDREMRWLEDTIIGVLSLGQRRPFLVKPLDVPVTPGRSRSRIRNDGSDDRDVIDLAPASGDLLVMGGRCQAAWLHAVPKVSGACGSRISVQYRWTSRRGRKDPNPPYSAPRHFSR
jgi:alkylated DNA repair dioxygenase AlkB